MVKKNRRFTGGAAPSGGWKEPMGKNTLPYIITCALCDRDLPLERYSPSARKRLASKIHRYGMEALDKQDIALCDGCGTQSRTEIHCMNCNQVRPIDEFASTQRQLPQPTCLPCQDTLQLDEGDKVADKQDEMVSELTRDMENLSFERLTEKNSDSAPAVANTIIDLVENEMRKESALKENEDTFVPANRRFGMRAESWTGGSSSASAIRTSAQNGDIIGDMSFDSVFDDYDDLVYSRSYQW